MFWSKVTELAWITPPFDPLSGMKDMSSQPLGQALMNQAQGRWPGRYCATKTPSMCFANTGGLFRALAMHEGR